MLARSPLSSRNSWSVGAFPPAPTPSRRILRVDADESVGVIATRATVSTAVISRFFGPSSLSTFRSIGRPWQFHPESTGESKPSHRAAGDDEVLQDLVERVTDVDVSVRVGRSAWRMKSGFTATRRGSRFTGPCVTARRAAVPSREGPFHGNAVFREFRVAL